MSIKLQNITSSSTKAKMAQATIEIPYLTKRMLVKEWKKGFLAATTLLDEKHKVAGEKSKLTQAIDFFSTSSSDNDMTNRSAVSFFCFKVQDAGKDLGVTNDPIAYKFLQHMPNGNKVHEKLKETIKPSMTKQYMTAVFEKAQNKTSNFHGRDPKESNCKVEERDEDDQLYFGGHRSQTKQRMSCKICRKANYTA